MKGLLAEAFRLPEGEHRRPNGHRKSDLYNKVIGGVTHAALNLDRLLNEAHDAEAPLSYGLRISAACHQSVLRIWRVVPVAPALHDALVGEQEAQGAADVPQLLAMTASPAPATLAELETRLMVQLEATKTALIAVQNRRRADDEAREAARRNLGLAG
jgi:hypothetical protein